MQKNTSTAWLLTGLLVLASGLPLARAEEATRLTGTVAETMNGGGYTYLLVDDGQAKQWVATTLATVKVGSKVEVPAGMKMKNFSSPTLKRVFPEIIFVGSITVDGQKQSASVPQASARVAMTPMSAAPLTLTGKVGETMDAGGYRFINLQDGQHAIWAATEPCHVKVGDRVTMPVGTVMPNFRSASLNRTFDEIHFVDHIDIGGQPGMGAPAADAGTGLPGGHPQIGAQSQHTPAPTLAEPIKQPAGAKSIAEIFAQSKTLAGQEITIKGQVTKFNAAIMGRNWVHLRDGTGTAGSDDLLVTTDAAATVGTIITVRGKLVIDQDFGSGYAYSVMLEKAAVQKN